MKKYRVKKIVVVLLLVGVFGSSTNANTSEEETKSNIVIIESASEAVQAGTYFIEVSTEKEDGEVVSELFKLNVLYPLTELNESNAEGIDAHDIVVTPGDLHALSKEALIQKANAHAWSTETGNEVNIPKVNPVYVKGDNGSVGKVEYGTQKGTSVSVSVFEQNEIYLDLGNVYVHQDPVIGDTGSKIRLLSIVVGSIIIVPIVVYIVVFAYVNIMKNKVTKFLYVEHKGS